MPGSLLEENSDKEPSLDLHTWKTEYLRQEVPLHTFCNLANHIFPKTLLDLFIFFPNSHYISRAFPIN